MKRLVILAALAAAGCAAKNSSVATVSASEAALGASGRVAIAYMQLPACGGSATLCAQPTIKASIRSAYDRAYTAVTAAQAIADAGGTPDMAAASAALLALQDIVTGLPKPTTNN